MKRLPPINRRTAEQAEYNWLMSVEHMDSKGHLKMAPWEKQRLADLKQIIETQPSNEGSK